MGEAPQGVTVAHGLVWVTVQRRAPAGGSSDGRAGRQRAAGGHRRPRTRIRALDCDFQRTGATCALLYNYPDRPFPEGRTLQPEVASGQPSVSADGQDLHVQDPAGVPLLAALERARDRGGLQTRHRARPRPERPGSFAAELGAKDIGRRPRTRGETG